VWVAAVAQALCFREEDRGEGASELLDLVRGRGRVRVRGRGRDRGRGRVRLQTEDARAHGVLALGRARETIDHQPEERAARLGGRSA